MILFGVAAFIVLQLGLGLYISRRVAGDSTNYIVAGRGLVLPLAAATLMAQAVDSNATLGNTDLSAQFGFWAGASLPIGLALCLFLTGLFFAKPMNRMGLLTLPDFYRRKYGRTVEVLAAVIMILGFTILLAGNIVAGGYLFEIFMGTSYVTGVILISLAVLAYTIAGGMFSDTHVSVLQLAVAFAGIVALLLWIAIAPLADALHETLNGPSPAGSSRRLSSASAPAPGLCAVRALAPDVTTLCEVLNACRRVVRAHLDLPPPAREVW